MKKCIITCITLLIISSTAFAQSKENTAWKKIIETEKPARLPMPSNLYQASKYAKMFPGEAYAKVKDMKLRKHPKKNLVNIEIIYRRDENMQKIKDKIDRKLLEQLGIEVAGVWKNRSSCWIKIEDAISLAEKFPKDYIMEAVMEPKHDDEGPASQNSNGYVSGAFRGGLGIRIAVFDGGFGSLQTRINNGVAPDPVYSWTDGASTNVAGLAGGVHGTACVELAYDHAPNSTYELYIVNNGTEMGQAVDLCIAHGVDIISHSMSRYNQGWFDNTGPFCDAVETAIAGNILFITSSGNRAESHWEGNFSDSDADNWHQFSGLDERNNITYNGNGNIHVALSWQPNANVDYDLYVYNSANTLIASSTNTGNTSYEEIGVDPVAGDYYISVKKKGTANAPFEFFTHQSGVSDYQYQTAAGSNTSPSNTTNNNCISVGAVHVNDYGSIAGTTGIITSYSSRGPTNSGNLVPKVTAPTNTSTETYGTLAFNGTSASTPNTAGMAAAFWSAHTHLDATGVRQLIFRMAQLYKDWGAGGTDQVYGNGGVFLYDYAANQEFLFRTGENSAVINNSRPYYSLNVAQNYAPTNGTVIILNNGAFSETGIYGNTVSSGSGKKILYRYPFAGNASFGY